MSVSPRAIFISVVVLAQLAVACDGATAPPDRPATVRATTSATTRPPPGPSKVVRRPRVPAGMTAGYMIYDREIGRAAIQFNTHHRFRSASVVKILIALDYLRSRGTDAEIPAGDLTVLRSMLRSSDDDAATALWTRGGRTRVIRRMTAALRLTDTLPPPAGRPGFWGYTAISAADVVRIYVYLLDPAHRRYGDFIIGNLRHAAQCAADGFDQYFGIPRAIPRPWAVKQGWSGYGSVPPQRCVRTHTSAYRPAYASHVPAVDLDRPVLHTTGTVGAGNRRIVVVLSLQPPGASWRGSAARLTAFTKAVYGAAVA
jgi:hypothetical protein